MRQRNEPSTLPCLTRVLLWSGLALACALPPLPAAGQSGPSAGRVFRARDGTPARTQDHETIRTFLRDAPIVEVEQLDIGSTRPRRLTLEQDELQMRAIFRAVDLERDGARIPDGEAYATFYDRAIHEVAAYELSRMLGIDQIPPTVVRSIDGEDGTVQLWIEDAMTETERTRRGLRPPQLRRWRRQHQVMRVFDALIHNSDRNTGNRLVDADWTLWMIDHTRGFQRPRGSNDFSGITQLPEPLWVALQALDHDELRERLDGFLEPLQFASLERRHEELVAHIELLILERGRAAVIVD